jgi:hypothetical protein
MKLYELFPNFTKLSYSERVEFLRSYRAKRAMELEENIKSKRGSSKVTLSDEEKALIKLLGITQKDLKALKGSIDSEQ